MYLSEESRQRYDVLLEKEREICRRLNFTIKVLSMICTIAIPPGTLADIVMKEISNLYSKLTMATKYFYYKFTKHHQTFLSAK